MKVTAYGHSAVAVERDGIRLAFDPGAFSDAVGVLSGASAAFVTHEHPDHLVPDAVRQHLAADPNLRVWAPAGAAAAVREGLPAEQAARVFDAEPGTVLDIGGVSVRIGGGLHAAIHSSVPRIANVTYLVDTGAGTAYHPGDSFDLPDAAALAGAGPDVVFCPVGAPWMKLGEAIDFIAAVQPRVVVPVHEALLSNAGMGLTDQRLGTGRTIGSYDYRHLQPGESTEV